jgi:type I restriction enzyme, S subunit
MKNLPKGWHSGKFEDFAILQRGFDITKEKARDGNVPVISSSGISYYHDTAKVDPPGVVTGRKGSLGNVYYVEIPFWPHDTTLWVKDFKGNHPKFIKIFLEGMDLTKFDAATSVPTLNRNNVHKLQIAFPPFPEQRKIADIITTWDKAVISTEQLIFTLQRRKSGLMQQLLTGQVRFTEFKEEWRDVKLEDIFTERTEIGFENLPLLSITEGGVKYREESNRRDRSSEDKSKYLRICPGDIGYNTMRMWQGRSALSKYEGIVSPAYTILKPKESVDVRFMAYLFKYQPMIHTFYRYSQGLVSDTWSLKYPVLAKIHVTIPEYEEQKRIADVLKLCDKEIKVTQVYHEKLQEQKKGLMQKLLTGEIRVKV